jgi:pilus assembly protein CpaE
MNKIPVVVIDREEKIIDKIMLDLESLENVGNVKYSNNILDLESLLVKKTPNLVFVGPSYELSDLEDMLINYNQSLNTIKIILFSKELSADLLKTAIRFNIHDVLEYPVKEKDLKNTFARAELIFGINGGSKNRDSRSCKKIMFFSTKGGSGNSFLAVNFALALRNKTNKEITIFDLNYQFGDTALMLNIYPKNTVFDLMGMNKFDPETIDIFLTTHNSGVRIMPSPIDPSQGEAIESTVTTKVFDGLSRLSDYLILDSPFGFSDSVLSLIESIDFMFLVATKDVPSIKNLKICLQLLDRLKFNRENVFVVLNRADSKVDIEVDEIEKTIQRKIDIKIPSDRIVPISVNKGTPAVVNTPRSPVSKNILKMLDVIPVTENELTKV